MIYVQWSLTISFCFFSPCMARLRFCREMQRVCSWNGEDFCCVRWKYSWCPILCPPVGFLLEDYNSSRKWKMGIEILISFWFLWILIKSASLFCWIATFCNVRFIKESRYRKRNAIASIQVDRVENFRTQRQPPGVRSSKVFRVECRNAPPNIFGSTQDSYKAGKKRA